VMTRPPANAPRLRYRSVPKPFPTPTPISRSRHFAAPSRAFRSPKRRNTPSSRWACGSVSRSLRCSAIPTPPCPSPVRPC
jgi:hypothetical protein